MSKKHDVHGGVLSHHKKKSFGTEKGKSNWEAHKAVVGINHRQLCHIADSARKPSDLGIELHDESKRHHHYNRDQHHPYELAKYFSVHLHSSYIVSQHTGIGTINDKLIQAVIHFLFYKVYFSHQVSR